ncbi:MAG: hypothetical protein HOP29_11790 [Phycisphaerales bacterium]|nr:hypothetical protein [Phycisphaerales bacterium]
MTTQDRFRRRAGIYLIVLGTSMVVMSIGLLGLTAVGVQRKAAAGADDLAQARRSAQSAIEWGLQRISANANWRATYPNGTWTANQPFAKGSLSLAGVDPTDGNLANDPLDPLTMTGTGTKGQATYRLRVALTAETRALTSLDVPLHAGGNIAFSSAMVSADGPISSNGSIGAATGSQVNADVEAVGKVTGGNYLSSTTSPITPREMPDPAGVFDYYINNGTVIPFTSLPRKLVTFERVLSSVVLSPTLNTFGAVNAQGIYVINCAGADLFVANSQIIGTLLVLDPGPNSKISGNMNFQVGLSGLPSLLVRGNICTDMSTAPDVTKLIGQLTGTTGLVTINPVGQPLRMDGLFYVSGNLTPTGGTLPIIGALVVGGAFTWSGTLSLTYDSQFRDNPPPGWLAPPDMVVTDGSWTPVVN